MRGVPPTWGQVAWLGLVAVFGTAGHYSMTRAFAVAPMTVTQPVTFLQLIWASLVGVFIFHEPLDGWVVLGGGLMIGAICYITWREARLRAILTFGHTIGPGIEAAGFSLLHGEAIAVGLVAASGLIVARSAGATAVKKRPR